VIAHGRFPGSNRQGINVTSMMPIAVGAASAPNSELVHGDRRRGGRHSGGADRLVDDARGLLLGVIHEGRHGKADDNQPDNDAGRDCDACDRVGARTESREVPAPDGGLPAAFLARRGRRSRMFRKALARGNWYDGGTRLSRQQRGGTAAEVQA
jgi:hypothetical protein